MQREVAKAINQFFDQVSIEAYVKERIDQLHEDMEKAELNDIPFYQGRIQELRLLLKAKEYAKNVLNLKEK